MKKFVSMILGVLICACLCLFGCTDKKELPSDVYLGDATIYHSTPTSTSYVFTFNYIYQDEKVYDADLLRCAVWFDDNENNKPSLAGLDGACQSSKYIAPHASLVISVYVDKASEIEKFETITVRYYILSKTSVDQMDFVLAEKTFKLADLLSQATDVPYV